MALLLVEHLRVCTKIFRQSLDIFSRGFQRLVEKLSGQNQTALFLRYVNLFFRRAAFCDAGYWSETDLFEPPSHSKRVQKPKA